MAQLTLVKPRRKPSAYYLSHSGPRGRPLILGGYLYLVF